MARTAPPPMLPPKYKDGHSKCRRLSPAEIASVAHKYKPPMTADEIREREEEESLRPDMSHFRD